MKKLIAIVIVFGMLASLSACNKKQEGSNSMETNSVNNNAQKEYALRFADEAFEQYTRKIIGE